MGAMFGWRRPPASWASRLNRSTPSSFPSEVRNLIATHLRRDRSKAFQTVPMPPLPIWATRMYWFRRFLGSFAEARTSSGQFGSPGFRFAGDSAWGFDFSTFESE